MIEINDIREPKIFNKITFSNFKKVEAKKELLKSLNTSEIESACYWSAEFICAGHFKDVWEIIIEFIGRYIHVGNPKLPIYINIRFETFKNILLNGYLKNEIRMRNNIKIRELFAEIITILCLSRKKHCINPIKIHKQEFQISHLTNNLKAQKISYSEGIFRKEDPKELFIAINELGYHLSKDSNNSLLACYWIEWLIEFSCICKCKAGRRSNIPVLDKFQMDIIWISWELLLHYSYKKNSMCHSIVEALLQLFCVRFSPAVRKRRRYILYMAVSLIVENIDLNIKVFQDKDLIEKVKSKIDVIYKQVKKGENAPKTDYLFNVPDKQKNLENSIKKIEPMNTLNFIPRSN